MFEILLNSIHSALRTVFQTYLFEMRIIICNYIFLHFNNSYTIRIMLFCVQWKMYHLTTPSRFIIDHCWHVVVFIVHRKFILFFFYFFSNFTTHFTPRYLSNAVHRYYYSADLLATDFEIEVILVQILPKL